MPYPSSKDLTGIRAPGTSMGLPENSHVALDDKLVQDVGLEQVSFSQIIDETKMSIFSKQDVYEQQLECGHNGWR